MNAYKQHQLNCSKFFDLVAEKSSGLTCHSGCYKCCLTTISIYTWEAQLIEDWFLELSEDEKSNLKERWSSPEEEKEDLKGQLQPCCIFLKKGKCSIYESRPIICRTQGLPLLIEQEVATCPLNFTEGLPDKKEWLNLEKVNSISAILQQKFSFENQTNENRITLTNLQKKLSSNN